MVMPTLTLQSAAQPRTKESTLTISTNEHDSKESLGFGEASSQLQSTAENHQDVTLSNALNLEQGIPFEETSENLLGFATAGMSALPSFQNANAMGASSPDALVKSPSALARVASTLDALTTQFGANPALRGADSITQKDLIARGLNPTMSQMVKPGDATLMPLTPMHRDSAPRQQGGENTLSHLTNLTQAIALTSPQSSDAAMPQNLIRGWADGVNSPQSTIDSALTRPVEWAPVKVDSNAGRWGEQMLQALHDKVSLQAQQNLQEARIRLDPPDLGKLDLIVRVEGDRLNVQLNANVTATREALAQVSERLRSELQSEHFVHVDVNVGGERDSSQQSPSQQTAQHIHTAREHDDDAIYTDITSEHWLNIQA